MNHHVNVLAGIDVDMGVAVGLASQAICSVARKEQADLILLSTRVDTVVKRWLFGSIAQEIVHRSSMPVLVLNERSVIPRMSHAAYSLQVQVILDGSSMAESLVEPAAQLLAGLSAPAQGILHLVHVADLPLASGKWRSQAHSDSVQREHTRQEAELYLARVLDRLYKGPVASPGLINSTSMMACTDMSKRIIQMAESSAKTEFEGSCTLIARAIHGRRRLRRRVERSVSRHILGSTEISLLTAYPQEIRAQL